MSLKARMTGFTSSGTPTVGIGERSVGRRRRMATPRRLSGAMPRERPNQTSSTASGMTANCGSVTPEMMRLDSALRLWRVSATCSSTGSLSGSGFR
ncbi:MAG: hypothetical protein EFKGCFLK_02481 [Rhodocyclaceae bacterium]|nr:hypothetical protein [Rhodocyclaceae bacterium]